MQEYGIENEDGVLVLRRTLGADGKSRAWINDTPVSIKTLKAIGDELVEVHGQFANHALLNPAMHRIALDDYATKNVSNFGALLKDVRNAYNKYSSASAKLHEIEEYLAKSAMEQEFLEHNISE